MGIWARQYQNWGLARTFVLTYAIVGSVGLIGCGKTNGADRAAVTAPLSAAQTEAFKETASKLAKECREETSVLGEVNDRYQQLAEQAASNVQYEERAPREAAMAYRLYAAHLIIQPTGQPKQDKIKDGLPWLSRALKVDPTVRDAEGLGAAEQFLTGIAEGRATRIDTQDYLRHLMRVAMVEASGEEVADEVGMYMGYVRKVSTPTQEGGSTPADDADYLSNYKKGDTTIGECMLAMKLALMTKYPGKDVGSSEPSFILPLPNGNTSVRYRFVAEKPVEFEWEVSKAKGLVIARNEEAQKIMDVLGGPLK